MSLSCIAKSASHATNEAHIIPSLTLTVAADLLIPILQCTRILEPFSLCVCVCVCVCVCGNDHVVAMT